MSKILIYGESGWGKTASIRNLPPANTGIINADKKALPLKGWRNHYKKVIGEDGLVDWSKSNYVEPKSPASVLMALSEWEKCDVIKYIIIDTLSHMQTADYINSTIGKDFNAYQRMGGNYYRILDAIRASNKCIVAMAHSDVIYDDTGKRIVKMKSHGKMVDAMIPPSFFTTVLVPVVTRIEGKTIYQFRTQSDGSDAAKSPCIFDDDDNATPALELLIPNDVKYVFDKLEEFENNN